jgi:hemerythrin-like domain-containing protein
METVNNKRREFLKKSVAIGTVAGITGLGLLAGCESETGEVTPAEDLMREHGVLDRIMLIYDSCRMHLINNEEFPLAAINNSAQIIRTFIEDYHEKLEENFLFPLFTKANLLADLVQVLYAQHSAGRKLTEKIIQTGKMKYLTGDAKPELIQLLYDFNKMYRPHAAREDTVLFPALKKIISGKKYLDLGEDFEKKEHELFGEGGFESMVEKVANIEKQLGIFDLAKFTPLT